MAVRSSMMHVLERFTVASGGSALRLGLYPARTALAVLMASLSDSAMTHRLDGWSQISPTAPRMHS